MSKQTNKPVTKSQAAKEYKAYLDGNMLKCLKRISYWSNEYFECFTMLKSYLPEIDNDSNLDKLIVNFKRDLQVLIDVHVGFIIPFSESTNIQEKDLDKRLKKCRKNISSWSNEYLLLSKEANTSTPKIETNKEIDDLIFNFLQELNKLQGDDSLATERRVR